jgi:outer membrane lipoprotein-sorting protein
MKRIIVLLIVLLTAAIALHAAEKKTFSKELAQELLKATDVNMFPQIFKSVMTMTTFRPGRKNQTYTYLIYSKGSTKSVMQITSPARDKGKKILMTDNNLWMDVPSVSRPIRMSKKDSFMGSAMSNEDLMNTTLADDYDPEIIDEKGNLWLLSLKAKRPDVAYAKIEFWLDKELRTPTEGTYYGLSGKAIKKMYFSDLKEIAGLKRPTKMKMEDLLEKGAYTEMVFVSMEELQSLPDYYFDATQMGR